MLAAAASPVPPPIDDLVPDPLLRDEVPDDLAWLVRLLPRADVYLQDEVEVALHPTLTRVWCPKGRRGQRLVEAPGNNEKEYGFGLVDWRPSGSIGSWRPADEPPRSVPSCVARSSAPKPSDGSRWCYWKIWASTHPRARSCCEQLLAELRGQLILVCTPAYDPESNRIEWLWRSLRRAVTHTHTREILPSSCRTPIHGAQTIAPEEVLRQIGSPFADTSPPSIHEALTHAA